MYETQTQKQKYDSELQLALELLDPVSANHSSAAIAVKLILEEWHAQLTTTPATPATAANDTRSAFSVDGPTIKARVGSDVPFALRRCALLADSGRLSECYASLLAVALSVLVEIHETLNLIHIAEHSTIRLPEWLPVPVTQGSPLRTSLAVALTSHSADDIPKRLLRVASDAANLGALEQCALIQ